MSDLNVRLTDEEHEAFKARIARENPDWAQDPKNLEYIAREFAYLVKRGEMTKERPLFYRGGT
jgi:hypothetical protein